MTLVFLDTETTGLHRARRPWEIAIIRRSGDEHTRLHICVDLADLDLSAAEPAGLAVSGFHRRHPQARPHRTHFPRVYPAADAARLVLDWTARRHRRRRRPRFDLECLSAMLGRQGLSPQWRTPSTSYPGPASGPAGARTPSAITRICPGNVGSSRPGSATATPPSATHAGRSAGTTRSGTVRFPRTPSTPDMGELAADLETSRATLRSIARSCGAISDMRYRVVDALMAQPRPDPVAPPVPQQPFEALMQARNIFGVNVRGGRGGQLPSVLTSSEPADSASPPRDLDHRVQGGPLDVHDVAAVGEHPQPGGGTSRDGGWRPAASTGASGFPPNAAALIVRSADADARIRAHHRVGQQSRHH